MDDFTKNLARALANIDFDAIEETGATYHEGDLDQHITSEPFVPLAKQWEQTNPEPRKTKRTFKTGSTVRAYAKMACLDDFDALTKGKTKGSDGYLNDELNGTFMIAYPNGVFGFFMSCN